MGHHRFRLPLLLALPLRLCGTGRSRLSPCNDEITRLMEIRLERAQASWEEENPTPSDFQLEAQYLNQVVKAESIKAHALKKYECRLRLSLPDEEPAED